MISKMVSKVQFFKMKSDPTIFLLIFIQPFMYSLLFGYLFQSTNSEDKMMSLFIGVAQMSMWQTLLFAGGIIVRHEFNREKTISFNLVSSVSLISIWIQRLISCILLSTPSFIISLTVGALVFGVTPSIDILKYIIIGIILYLFSLLSLGFPLILLLFLNPEGGKLIQTLAYPIFLLSGMIVSIDFFDPWVRFISYLLPITWSTHWLQFAIKTGTVNWNDCIMTIIISIIYLIFSLYLYRYIISHVRKTGEISL